MKGLGEIHLVVAVTGEDGLGHFQATPPPAHYGTPETGEVAFAWSTDATPNLADHIGGPAADNSFPPPGASKFALVFVPPRASGAWDAASHKERAMHASATIDYEVIISGKIDIILDTGERRTLMPGSCLVMAGANHAWSNPYDEPCVYAAIVLGAHSETEFPPFFANDPAGSQA
jgi:hypothetical protein